MSAQREDPITIRALRRVGTRLREKYTIVRLIGIGGMGAVYAARHRNGHRVAIKILHERLSSDPDIERLFRREAQISNRIDHPGIVPVLDDDVTEDGCVFLVMPILEGETYRARWERNGRHLPVSECVAISIAILDVLSAAHSRKIAHRDVKPENIFITSAGNVCMLDFGIARLFDREVASATRSGRAVGTPVFMAPEQALGRSREIDARTDLWSVGATFYSAVSGAFVHDGESASEILVRAATRPARPLVEAAPHVPAQIAAVVDRSLAFAREERWPDAASMAEALRNAHLVTYHALPPKVESAPVVQVDRDALDSVAIQEARVSSADEHGLHGSAAPPRAGLQDDRTRTATEAVYAGTLARGQLLRRSRRSLLLGASGTALIAMSVWATTKFSRPQTPRTESSDMTAGVQSWKDASLTAAEEHFERALNEDKGAAMAQVYLMLMDTVPTADTRNHYRGAVEYRSRLREDERAVLDAYEPAMEAPPKIEETADRLKQVQRRFPNSQLAAYAYGITLLHAGRTSAGRSALLSLIATDKSFVLPWFDVALSYSYDGDLPAAESALKSCLDASPFADSCLALSARLNANQGNCEAAATYARRMIANPTSALASGWGSTFLAGAIFDRTGSVQSSRAAFEQYWQQLPDSERRRNEAKFGTRLAVLDGDFALAGQQLHSWRDTLDGVRDEAPHQEWAKEAMYVALELGKTDQAAALANEYLQRREAWVEDSYFDYEIIPLRVLHLAHAMSPDEFVRRREAWALHQKRRPTVVANRGVEWVVGYARGVASAEDARDALRKLPEYLPLPDPITRNVESDDAIGWTYVLGGRLEDALPYLRRGAASCRAPYYPFEHTWANLHLGIALQLVGDVEGACASFRTVIRRWGKSQDSVSALQARQHMEALRCPGP